MNVADVIRTVIYNKTANAGRLEAVATELRRLDLLPKGGRGLWAPQISPTEAATLLLTFAAVERVQETGDVISNLATLEHPTKGAFLPFVAEQISGSSAYSKVREITIFPQGTLAEVAIEDGVTRFLPSDAWKSGLNPDAQQKSFGGRIGYIGGGLLRMIAQGFEDTGKGEIVAE